MANASFNGIAIGDHAWVSISTSNELEVHKIPRADGAIIRRRGGGVKNITVNAWVKRTDVGEERADVEQYFDQLASAFGSGAATLIVNGVSYTNCFLQSVSQDETHNRWSRFTVTFLRSGN
ncbi:MAG TPA: hypothetical protein VMV86_00080 [Methanosarcinales archaeon]|nr:hypothetical protein [Methanosarcinales archaeon]